MPGKNTNKTDKRNKVNKSNKNQIVLIFKDLCILWWTQSRTGLYYQNLFSDLFMYLKLSAVPRRILLYVEHKVNFLENFAKMYSFYWKRSNKPLLPKHLFLPYEVGLLRENLNNPIPLKFKLLLYFVLFTSHIRKLKPIFNVYGESTMLTYW